jgi:FkbM family methyltransferase
MKIIKDLAYRTLDVLAGGSGIERQIGGERISFPARWSRYYESGYEPETFRFFRENLRNGDTVLDIGGHIGLFAVVTARLVGRKGKVFSFEPTPFTRSVLEEVVALNGCAEIVEVRGEAVSSQGGETVFFDTGNTISNANSLVRTELSKNEIPVKLVSVDEFAKERNLRIDCLKIDVEGAELDVLIGARDTFLTHRPVARLGLHPSFILQNGQTLDNLWQVISEYNLSVIFDGTQVEKEWFCSQAELFDVDLIPS